MTPTAMEAFRDIRAAAFWIAGAVTIVTLLLTSGINKKFVNEAISRSKGGQAGVDDLFTLMDVLVRAFPLVAALLLTALIVQYSGWQGWPLVFALIFVWGVAAGLAGQGDPTPVSRYGGGPWGILAGLVVATFTPYTHLLAIQALVVAGGTAIAFTWLKDRWA